MNNFALTGVPLVLDTCSYAVSGALTVASHAACTREYQQVLAAAVQGPGGSVFLKCSVQ